MFRSALKAINLTIVAVLMSIASNTAQSKKELSLEHLLPGGNRYSAFVPKNLSQLQFIGDKYIYKQGDTVKQGSFAAKAEKQLIDRCAINKILKEVGADTIKRLPPIKGEDINGSTVLHIKNGDKIYHIDTNTHKVIATYVFSKNDKNADYSPNAGAYISTTGDSLLLHTRSGERKLITSDLGAGISLGANNVHRNEFGIKKGIFWSPLGESVAFYRMDESKVKDYPLVNISARQAECKNIKYPMAGMQSHTVKIGVYNLPKKKLTYLKTGIPTDKYLTNITWSPDGKKLYVFEVNREQNKASLIRYNATTGSMDKNLFTETDNKYVEPENGPMFLPDGSFAILSRRNGFRHAYLYNAEGEQLKQLTDGAWEVISAILSTDGRFLYITATEESPLERHLYRIEINSGIKERVTKQPGVHNITMSPSAEYYIDNYSSHNIPRIIKIGESKTGETSTLLSAPDSLSNYLMPKIECGTIKAADDSTDLYYRLVKPATIDSTKKLPAIIYVYGGPHVQQITDSYNWGMRGWDIYMANKGYIVFTLDNRGSANRGMEFESVTHRKLGEIELADQLRGVDFLKSLPYVDSNRIGVHGWSFGGFMTLNMMLNAPDIFKVGVAGGAVTDWKYYEVMYGERYMGTPENNHEGYKKSNMNNLAGNLNGRLLLIHCDMDPVVVWQNTLSFLNSSIKKGTQPDYFVYPGHTHNVIGRDRVHLYRKITRYFDDFLLK